MHAHSLTLTHHPLPFPRLSLPNSRRLFAPVSLPPPHQLFHLSPQEYHRRCDCRHWAQLPLPRRHDRPSWSPAPASGPTAPQCWTAPAGLRPAQTHPCRSQCAAHHDCAFRDGTTRCGDDSSHERPRPDPWPADWLHEWQQPQLMQGGRVDDAQAQLRPQLPLHCALHDCRRRQQFPRRALHLMPPRSHAARPQMSKWHCLPHPPALLYQRCGLCSLTTSG
mmetsp:Transcript_23543/g.75722  ORF Transcript_23543/g.75722 Transcript_23543/m.75722 type:complete len:221 (-) Transcript_23543:1440-2102(-)